MVERRSLPDKASKSSGQSGRRRRRDDSGGSLGAQLYFCTDSINYHHNAVRRGQSNAGFLRQDREQDDIVSVIFLFCKPLVKAQLRLKAIKAIISMAGEDGQGSHSISQIHFQNFTMTFL